MSRALALVLLTACGRLDFDGRGDASPDDRDRDGIADALDNCPDVANPDQANEDGDAFGDACDPCPPFAETGADQDHDGVPDLCDPNPGTAGDQIVRFDGFNAAPADAELDGTWTFDGRAVVTSSLDALAAVTWTAPSGNYSVFAVGTIDAMFGSSVPRPVGVVAEFQLATANGITCVFGIDPSNQQVFALADNASSTALNSELATASVGTTTTFHFDRVGTMYTCTGSQAAFALTGSSTLAVTPDRAGVFTRSASAHFDWVMVVKTP